MATFTYDHSIGSPSPDISHIFGFSHQGKYLAFGDDMARRVYIIDNDPQQITCIPTVVAPTALTWDPIEAEQFIVGFRNGRFSVCSFKGVEISEVRYDALEDRGAIQSLALTPNGLTLAIAISHGDVFVFNRRSYSGMFPSLSRAPQRERSRMLIQDSFKLVINATSEYNFGSAIHGNHPNPRSLCFTPTGLFISYERDGIMWVTSLFAAPREVIAL